MINKQNLWFLTLFSLILVLSVYYITMPNELLLTNNSNYTEDNSDVNVSIEESEALVAMRVDKEEEREKEMSSLKEILTSEDVSSEEKNNAYEQIKQLNDLKGKEEQLEEKIKKQFELDSFIKINNNEIKVVVIKKEHDVSLANNIMKSIQEEFDKKVYVIVKFEK